MKRGAAVCATICGLIFLSGLAGTLVLTRPSQSGAVEIVQGGEVLYSFDLSALEEAQSVEISGEAGSNTVHVGPDGVYMESADCADQSCVNMGRLQSALPIVCLPHELIVRFADPDDGAGLDAVAG